MIDVIIGSAEDTTAEVVTRAFERSFTSGQVRRIDDPMAPTNAQVAVVLGPTEADAAWLEPLARQRAKILLFGPLGPRIARLAGVTLQAIPKGFAHHCDCPPASTHGISESSAALVYHATGLGGLGSLPRRSFCRFDFTNEWNNLGYGRIDMGEAPWSLAGWARCIEADIIAEIVTSDGASHGAAATLRDLPTASILWFARPVGPVDGPDWRIVEAFVADHRNGKLPCRPCLRDIPHGVGAAVTMRLDCDEDIASGRALFELYRARSAPLSVAVKTNQPSGNAHADFLRDLFASGGAILSHSASHAPSWGGSAAAAEAEAMESKSRLEAQVPGLSVRYAVSPFHQNPTFVPAALARAGYRGFVGGTIAGDPEYLMARGGAVPFGPSGFVSHSQSCMLHGDCLLPARDPIAIYKQAFRNAQATSQFFGYLDHPFSERYSYGWANEAERLRVHGDFLDFMQVECDRAQAPLLFLNEETCLDFMLEKADTSIVFDDTRDVFSVSRTHAAGLPLSVGFKGRIEAAANG
jgi:hypothetical protein